MVKTHQLVPQAFHSCHFWRRWRYTSAAPAASEAPTVVLPTTTMATAVVEWDAPEWAAAPIAGVSLLERQVRACLQRGYETVWVRGGFELAGPVPGFSNSVCWLRDDETAPVPSEVVPGNEFLGFSVTSEAARRQSEWALLQSCRRSYDGPADRFIGRPLSLRVTRFLSRLPIKPNQVTGISFLLGLSAAALIGFSEPTRWPFAAAMLFASWILDSVDGELARVTFQGSRLGMTMDNVSDDIIDNTLTVAFGLAMGPPWLAVAVAAATARSWVAITSYVQVARQGHPGDTMAFRWWFERDQKADELYARLDQPLVLLRSLGRRDSYVVAYCVFLAMGVPLLALVLACANAVAYAILCSLHLFWYARPAK